MTDDREGGVMGERTDDHEYRGSHHQTPGTLQGGRTDADTIREILDGQPLARRNPGDPGGQAREDADAALDRLEARLVAVEDALRGLLDYIGVDLEDSAEQLESFDAPSVVVSARRLLDAADTGQGPCPCGHHNECIPGTPGCCRADTGQGTA